MKLQGAVIKEQGITFAICIVKHQFTQSAHDAGSVAEDYQRFFPGVPVVLASQDPAGRFRYLGRTDLVEFLASIDASRIPWMEYTF